MNVVFSRCLFQSISQFLHDIPLLMIMCCFYFFRTGARFSIRVSAVEVVGRSENLKDLLQDQSTGI